MKKLLIVVGLLLGVQEVNAFLIDSIQNNSDKTVTVKFNNKFHTQVPPYSTTQLSPENYINIKGWKQDWSDIVDINVGKLNYTLRYWGLNNMQLFLLGPTNLDLQGLAPNGNKIIINNDYSVDIP